MNHQNAIKSSDYLKYIIRCVIYVTYALQFVMRGVAACKPVAYKKRKFCYYKKEGKISCIDTCQLVSTM